MHLRQLILSDLYRYYENTGFLTFLKGYVFNRGFNYMCWFRIANSKVPFASQIAVIVLRIKQKKYGIYIPRDTVVGYGLFIGHGGPCIVNPTARIGNNVNLSQYVTIGSNEGQAATIGDNTYIGPNVILVEDITIGTNVTIGAGSVVLRSIADNCTAAGNPARVLNQKRPGRFVNNRWRKKV